MLTKRQFWFMAFRQVLGTLAQLPGDAARLVSSDDWALMSASLGVGRTEEQVRELFFPDRSREPVSDASERNPRLLRAFDDRGYWDVYERILRTSALRFPDIHRITGLSQGQGRVLLQVLNHVVNWLSAKRTAVANRQDNKKPPLRKDLEPALDYFGPTRLREAEKRLKVFFPPATPPHSSRESASVLLQQEVLEFALEHLADFNAKHARAHLETADGDLDNGGYAARFREDTWVGVLRIVRWYVGSDFRPEWLPVEGSSDKPPELEPSTQAASLTDAFCNYAAGLPMVRDDPKLRRKLQSSEFRTALATWLSKQCDEEPDSEEMRSHDGARGSRGSHAEDDGKTVVVAAAAAAKPLAGGPQVVTTRPVAKPVAKPATEPSAEPAAKPAATRNAPVPVIDETRCMAEGKPVDRDGRRKVLTDKAQGNGTTKVPARKKQDERSVLRPTREGHRQQPNTATPRRQAEKVGWIEPSPVRTNLSSKPGKTLPGVRGPVTPARALAKGPKAPLADM